MLYLVTTNSNFQSNTDWKIITVEESLKIMNSWSLYQYDSETSGRDSRICKLLCIQFGNDAEDTRIVVDCLTVDIMPYKDFMENHLMVGQNLKFDLQFLYNYGITVLHVYDTMIVEQLLYLGYPPYPKPGGISYALNAIAYRYLGINIDKSVRGEIIWRGLDRDVILYAAGDVTYIERIMHKQLAACKEKDCVLGARIECRFVPVIAYLEWCGIKLDIDRWKAKMQKDNVNLIARKKALDTFVENYAIEHQFDDGYIIRPFVYKKAYKNQSLRMFPIPHGAKVLEQLSPIVEDDCTSYMYLIREEFPYVEVNLQGDLWAGFDTSPHCTMNWNSSKQVVSFMQLLGFNTETKDKKTGETKDTALEKHLKSQKGINDEFLDLYFEFKESSKVCSTYGETQINAVNPITGRIHTVYKQLGAASGRMSCGSTQPNEDLAKLKHISPILCKYPNLQQLPADEQTRSCFIAEPGYKFCSCDYSAIESRLGGDIYQDKAILDEFLLRSGDMHSLVAKMIFPELKDVPIEDIKKKYPELRKRAKPVEFSQQFGGSEYAIASSLGCSMEEAKEIKRFYDQGFKGVTRFKRIGSQFVRNHGYVLICKYTGHKMYWYDWENWLMEDISDERSRAMHYKAASKWDRMALNAPTQGTGSIILKFAMIQLFKWIVDNEYFDKVKIVALVHDECCIEYPEDLIDMPNILEHIMEEAASQFCKSLPIPAEASVGDHWIH